MAAVLFICEDGAALSPLAEAVARSLRPDVEAWSASLRPSHVRPWTRAVLAEAGLDDAGLRSRDLAEVPLDEVDVAVFLAPAGRPPFLPRRIRLVRWPMPDPSSAPADEALDAWRAARDELLRRIPALLDELAGPGEGDGAGRRRVDRKLT